MKKNYQILMGTELDAIAASGKVPRLLLQSCCGPCSSYVLSCLARVFHVDVYFYNPNIYPPAEYEKRLGEQIRLLREMPFPHRVSLLPAPYDPAVFADVAAGLETEPEGGSRCTKCFLLRLEATAKAARDGGYDYFTTTLSVSPHKNAPLLNAIGENLAKEYGVRWLPADFKKKEGYKISIQLSKEYDLYRQDYCGCRYSLRDADAAAPKNPEKT